MKTFVAAVAAFLSCATAFGWSQKGHDVTAYIAECHLTPVTAAAVDSLLDGKSIVYWSNWLDNASHTPEYRYTSTWHYKNINAGVSYEDMYNHPNGNIELATVDQIEKLKSGELTPEESALALKILIHLMGDMHQPMHLGRQTDLGGNKIKVKYFDRDYNLHSIWDGQLVESAHKWSYHEWQEQIDRAKPEEVEYILSGDVRDWCKQTHAMAGDVYGSTPEGTKISYDYIAMWTPAIEQQLLKGGLRLAHVLNLIFDPEYGQAECVETEVVIED